MNINEKALYKKIGAKIKAKRSEIQLSQQDLAREVGLTRTSITNIEAGEQKVQLHTLYEIALLLDLEISEILPPVGDLLAGIEGQTGMDIEREHDGLPQTMQFVHDIFDDLEDK